MKPDVGSLFKPKEKTHMIKMFSVNIYSIRDQPCSLRRHHNSQGSTISSRDLPNLQRNHATSSYCKIQHISQGATSHVVATGCALCNTCFVLDNGCALQNSCMVTDTAGALQYILITDPMETRYCTVVLTAGSKDKNSKIQNL